MPLTKPRQHSQKTLIINELRIEKNKAVNVLAILHKCSRELGYENVIFITDACFYRIFWREAVATPLYLSNLPGEAPGNKGLKIHYRLNQFIHVNLSVKIYQAICFYRSYPIIHFFSFIRSAFLVRRTSRQTTLTFIVLIMTIVC